MRGVGNNISAEGVDNSVATYIDGVYVPSSGATIINLLVPAIPSAVPAWAVGLGFGISVAIGLVFGLWPAFKAARLDPIDALRYE